MLSTRRYDDSKNGLHDWTFMTVHNWGENPKGVWVMNVTDNIATLNKGVDVNGYLQHDTSKQEADVEDLEEEVISATTLCRTSRETQPSPPQKNVNFYGILTNIQNVHPPPGY